MTVRCPAAWCVFYAMTKEMETEIDQGYMATEGISAIEMEDDDIKAMRNKCAAAMLKEVVLRKMDPVYNSS